VRTWKIEMLVVWTALVATLAITRGGQVEWLGALAVLAAFGHTQVTERMREREAVKAKPDVACHRWALGYFLAKEALWLVYFVLHHSWSALVGVGVFLLYPLWRKWWRARQPRRSLDVASGCRLYLNGREFILAAAPVIQADLPWRAELFLELHKTADGRDLDHMVRMGALLHVFFAMPGGLNWGGKADVTQLKFSASPWRPGLEFASLALIGDGGLQSV
jgi:hypothetical protein